MTKIKVEFYKGKKTERQRENKIINQKKLQL